MIVTLVKISRKELKNGSLGCSIQTDQHGEKWLGGFDNDKNHNWKIGDKVGIEVVNNGKWLNYKETDEPVPVETELSVKYEGGDGQALGNAKTNAVNIVIVMLEKGEYNKQGPSDTDKVFTNIDAIEQDLTRLVTFIYNVKPGSDDQLPWEMS